jgi:hypothetical protein
MGLKDSRSAPYAALPKMRILHKLCFQAQLIENAMIGTQVRRHLFGKPLALP